MTDNNAIDTENTDSDADGIGGTTETDSDSDSETTSSTTDSILVIAEFKDYLTNALFENVTIESGTSSSFMELLSGDSIELKSTI